MTGVRAAVALVVGVALGGLAGTVLRCVVDAGQLGPVVPVHPAIRAWDAGVCRDVQQRLDAGSHSAHG